MFMVLILSRVLPVFCRDTPQRSVNGYFQVCVIFFRNVIKPIRIKEFLHGMMAFDWHRTASSCVKSHADLKRNDDLYLLWLSYICHGDRYMYLLKLSINLF